jgi:hypothetical protein
MADRGPFKYDVALSFAGEDRAYVDAVAAALTAAKMRVFYDKYESVELWGKDLYQHLTDVYSTRAQYCVTFISQAYASKLWPRHELKSAQSRAFSENGEYILPARFDNTELPGLLPTTAYVDLRVISPVELADLIIRKMQCAVESKNGGATSGAPRQGCKESDLRNGKHIVDCDADLEPWQISDPWVAVKHEKRGVIELTADIIPRYYLRDHQLPEATGRIVDAYPFRREFARTPNLNANFYWYLLMHEHLIPQSWKKKSDGYTTVLFFPGTVYRARDTGQLRIHCMFWEEDGSRNCLEASFGTDLAYAIWAFIRDS